MLLILRQTRTGFCLSDQKYLYVGQVLQGVCRSKHKYADKIIKLNRENSLLFGPVIKAKRGRKKAKKNRETAKGVSSIVKHASILGDESKPKKKVKIPEEGISSVLSQAKEQRVFAGDVWTRYEDFYKQEPIAPEPNKSKVKKSKSDDIGHPTSVKSSQSVSRCVSDKTVSSFKIQTSAVNRLSSETDEQSLFDFIKDFPVNRDERTDECSKLENLVQQLPLRNLPSVSTILNLTQSERSRFFLNRWREQSIAELGREEFLRQQEEIKRDGINLHANIQQYLSGVDMEDIQIQPRTEVYWKSVKTVFDKVGEVKAMEDIVTHPSLQYRGAFDCVAMFRDDLCVIDWKTSRKPKPLLSNTFDNPLQLAAYIGAINTGTDLPKLYGPISKGVLVIAYPWGEPAHVHVIKEQNLQKYWKLWCERLHQYWNLIIKNKQAELSGQPPT